MKILLLISGLLFSGGLFADMDNICDIAKVKHPNSYEDIAVAIKELNCERNNILNVQSGRNFESSNTQLAIASYCRFDRDIFTTLNGFTCVLYSDTPREILTSSSQNQ